MLPVLKTVRTLLTIQIFTTISCQNIFGEQDVPLQHYASSNDDQISSFSFNDNIYSRDPNIQSINLNNGQYQQNDNTNDNNDFSKRSPYTRNRKVYRIKNPFQKQFEEAKAPQTNITSGSSGTVVNDQYPSVQYSLPPEDFLQQLRAENQYYQQRQTSTPAPNLGYTATPIPQQQYQYSTIQYSQPSYDDSHQHDNNPISLEPKSSHGSAYMSSPSPYQYSTQNTFIDSVPSTPSSGISFLSTPINTGLYSYVSSASPTYVASPSNQQSFVSSPLSIIQTNSPDLSNRGSTVGSNSISYENNDFSRQRYPINLQQQYHNDYSTTTTPNPSHYSENVKDQWQNNISDGNNGASQPTLALQNNFYNQYPNYQNQEDIKSDLYGDNVNSDTHRIGSTVSANNMFVNYIQSDNQPTNNLKLRTIDIDSETSKTDRYSNGDYGWKLDNNKPLIDSYSATNYPRYSTLNKGNFEDAAVSHINFNMGTIKPFTVNHSLKSSIDSAEQDFAQTAAKANERFKQQQQLQQQQQQQQQHQQQYANINTLGTNSVGSSGLNHAESSYYNNIEKQKNKVTDLRSNYYSYGSLQNDLVTASPFYLPTGRDNVDTKQKHPFDHDKALKNIVTIDVTNVVGNSESKAIATPDNDARYMTSNYGKDQVNQNVQQYIRPVSDGYYKDKNAIYGFNVKTKSDDYSFAGNFKQPESNIYGTQHQSQESNYNQGYTGSSHNHLSQQLNNYHDSIQSPSIQQSDLVRNQNQIPTDIGSILKLNDIPYKLTQGLSNDALKIPNHNFDQGGIPSPLPVRINQNVGSHQLDVTNGLLNKLLFNRQPTVNIDKPEIDSQTGGLISTINGYKVANPFNVDLKLIAEMLKEKSTLDDSLMVSHRDQYTNLSPYNFDLTSQVQQLFKNNNNRNLASMKDGSSVFSSPYIGFYSNSRLPYQKYSRSQEEEESIVPIAAASNAHPIGAVMEQDDLASNREVTTAADFTAQGDVLQDNFEENKPKTRFMHGSRITGERYRHPNLLSGRRPNQRKHPKLDMNEPYPLLKPPLPQHSSRGHMKLDSKYNRRRRVRMDKPKLLRIIETEPLFEAGTDPENLNKRMNTVLHSPASVEAKSDIVDTELTT